jgi:hypothetical protein
VRVNAQGDENAFGFTILFDPSKLAFRSASKTSATGPAVLNVNSSRAASGIVAVALALPVGSMMASGSQDIVSLAFATAENATGTVAVAFTDWPVVREVSNPTANAVPATYNNGSVNFDTTPIVPPVLRVERFPEGLLLSWPASAEGFLLETTETLGGAWTQWDVLRLEIAGRTLVTLPFTNASRYFRLRRP